MATAAREVDPEIEVGPKAGRSQARQFVALLVIGAALAQALGVALKTPSQVGANDISRWCTVWSLLERGTYAIDDCPWQSKTQDKVLKRAPFQKVAAGKEPVEHYYSSKPPLLPTLIAGLLYPARKLSGVPLDREVEQPRSPRYVEKPDEDDPKATTRVLETPKEPARWPAFVFYFNPVVVLLNIVPYWVMLVFFARLLDRFAANDWAWFFSLAAAAWGTLLLVFDQTLNNHTVAASSAFFALYALVRIWDEGARSPALFASAGFFGAFCACNELPAALFGILLFVMLLVRFPRQTLLWFVPAAAVPCAAFLATQYLAFGQLRPVYEEFGTRSYNYEGSYWNAPLEMDWFNLHPEPYAVYLFHMTFGHHGVFSLSPIFLFSIVGGLRMLRKGPMRAVAWMTIVLTAAMLAFYTWNPKARNYGGSTQGLRWLFWLIPFWLLLLPSGVEGGQRSRRVRWLTLAALFVSAFSVGYALRAPWSHPWFLDAMEHLDIYALKRYMKTEAGRIELFLTELRVADWPGAVRWYVEVLGMRPALEDVAHQYALLEAGNGRLALKGGDPDGPSRGAIRLTFRVDDVDAERARLVGLGVAVGEPSDNPREHYREVRLSDPEGTPITLFGWLRLPIDGM